MSQNKNYENDLASIRSIMEKSVKFISLSGLGGVMAGIYALGASYVAYCFLFDFDITHSRSFFLSEPKLMVKLGLLGLVTLVVSLATGWLLSYRKAKRLGMSMWNSTSQRLLINMGVPLGAGGLFVVIILAHGYIGLIAPATLLFYGLALVAASHNLFDEMRYLGYSEIVLGLLSTIFIGYGLVFWALGFGVLHIVYGVLMYRKYDA